MPSIAHSSNTPHDWPVMRVLVQTDAGIRMVHASGAVHVPAIVHSEPAAEPSGRHVPAVPNTLLPTQSSPVGHAESNVLHMPPIGAAVRHVPSVAPAGVTHVSPALHMLPVAQRAPTAEPLGAQRPEVNPRCNVTHVELGPHA